jgi:hypothetical protein
MVMDVWEHLYNVKDEWKRYGTLVSPVGIGQGDMHSEEHGTFNSGTWMYVGLYNVCVHAGTHAKDEEPHNMKTTQ